MATKAKLKKTIAVKKGVVCVPEISDKLSANNPAKIATTEFNVVMVPNMSFKDPPASSRC